MPKLIEKYKNFAIIQLDDQLYQICEYHTNIFNDTRYIPVSNIYVSLISAKKDFEALKKRY